MTSLGPLHELGWSYVFGFFFYHIHISNKETEAQRGDVTGPRSHSSKAGSQNLSVDSGPQGSALNHDDAHGCVLTELLFWPLLPSLLLWVASVSPPHSRWTWPRD